jgi:uncharacterized tellurite resistance protein B-like protein
MAPNDRILPICEILLGAAYADGKLDQREQETVRELLADLTSGPLAPEVEKRIKSFDPRRFNLRAAATPFKADPVDDKKRLLYLVAAIHEADEELDLAEDAFLKSLGDAIGLAASELSDLTLVVEEEELKASLSTVRKGPPLPPGKKDGSVDVDLD